MLYTSGLSVRTAEWVLDWLGVDRPHVATWTWIEKFGKRLRELVGHAPADLPAILLVDETVVTQRDEEFTLFAALDPETQALVPTAVAPIRTYLTTRRFLEELKAIYGRLPPIVVSEDASCGPAVDRVGIARIVYGHGIRNCIERWIRDHTSDRRVLRLVHRPHCRRPPPTGCASSPGSGITAFFNLAESSHREQFIGTFQLITVDATDLQTPGV